mmetsp:Transcript_14798/g.48479  ORF Transcript_14798/g.48479 Transcript_14798/m.48479 type:complete len:407 (+) Transcript_14798:231-1451(+)
MLGSAPSPRSEFATPSHGHAHERALHAHLLPPEQLVRAHAASGEGPVPPPHMKAVGASSGAGLPGWGEQQKPVFVQHQHQQQSLAASRSRAEGQLHLPLLALAPLLPVLASPEDHQHERSLAAAWFGAAEQLEQPPLLAPLLPSPLSPERRQHQLQLQPERHLAAWATLPPAEPVADAAAAATVAGGDGVLVASSFALPPEGERRWGEWRPEGAAEPETRRRQPRWPTAPRSSAQRRCAASAATLKRALERALGSPIGPDLDKLPECVASAILELLPPKSLAGAALANRAWRRLAYEERLWQRHAERIKLRRPSLGFSRRRPFSWRRLYAESLCMECGAGACVVIKLQTQVALCRRCAHQDNPFPCARAKGGVALVQVLKYHLADMTKRGSGEIGRSRSGISTAEL